MKFSLRIGPVELVERLASGSAGQVWHAVHRTHRYSLAIKLLPDLRPYAPYFDEHPGRVRYAQLYARSGEELSEHLPDDELEWLTQEFVHDINTMTRLSHPNIVSVYDVSAEPPLLAMELAEGSCRQTHAINSWSALQRFLTQTLDALGYLHSRDLVHCDIKPDNILRFSAPSASAGEPPRQFYKLTDFGLAHELSDSAKFEGTTTQHPTHSDDPFDAYCGSPPYSPPEQILGEVQRFGPWTDLYSLGCTAFECASGTPPFGDADFFTLTARHLDEAPRQFRPRFRVPSGFETWLLRLLEKDCSDRYQSADQAAAALKQLQLEPSPSEMLPTSRA